MAIQFQCTGCHQAIEVDDDLANRLVACPYCQQTVRAPLRSSLADTAPIAPPARQNPTGIESAAQDVRGSWPDLPVPPPQAAQRGNLPGNLGLLAGLLAWGILLVLSLQMVSLATPHLPVPLETRQPTQQEMAEALEKVFADPAHRSRLVLFVGLTLACALLAVLLSIVGLVRRNARKGTSIAGLIIGGALMICFIASLMLNIQGTRGGSSRGSARWETSHSA